MSLLRSRWFTFALLACVLLLLLSVNGIEGKKKKKGEKKVVEEKEQPKQVKNQAPTYTAEELSIRESQSKQRARKQQLVQKRESKRAKELSARLKKAEKWNEKLKQQRQERKQRQIKQKALEVKRNDIMKQKKRENDTPELRKRAQDKIKALLALTAKSSTRIISFNTQEYHQFISEGPRNYYLMVTYTALSPAHKCHYCHMAYESLQPVALAHYERSKTVSAQLLSATSLSDVSDYPVFFVNIDMAKNQKLFEEMSFNSAPMMVLAPPRLASSPIKTNDFLKKLPPKYRFNLQSSMQPNDFASFVNKLAGCHVELNSAPASTGDLILVSLGLIGMSVAAWRFGYDILMFLRGAEGIRFPIVVGGWLFYAWCISGGMYNIIRHTQFAETRKDGSVNYINGDARDQYAAEGMILGALNLAVAVMIVLMNSRAYGTTEVVDVKNPKKLSPFQHLKNAIAPYFSPAICLGVGMALWAQIIGIYTRKNWSYRNGFVWRT